MEAAAVLMGRYQRELLCIGNCSRRRIYTAIREDLHRRPRQHRVLSAVESAPTVDNFRRSPTSIASGKISTVTWSSTNAIVCTASGGWSGKEGDQRYPRGIADKHYDPTR